MAHEDDSEKAVKIIDKIISETPHSKLWGI